MTTELLLNRERETADATLGRFFFGTNCSYFSVEDLQRKVKQFGITAIPEGRYKVIIDMSTRFKRMMPHVLNVPGFTGVRIHSGNTSADTDGCIILGLDRTPTGVSESRAAISNFMPRLEAALLEGEVWLTVKSAFPVTK